MITSQQTPSEREPMVAAAARPGLARGTATPAAAGSTTLLIRMAMKLSRSRWFVFLRRVFHYQNGITTASSNIGSNPFNSSSWMLLEFVSLVVQISITSITLSVSKTEKPVWPMRIWIILYDIGCVISLLLLCWRYKQLVSPTFNVRRGHGVGYSNPTTTHDLEQQHGSEEDIIRRGHDHHVVNKCRTSLELFNAMWFVMGNVWIFDSRFQSFQNAPKLHVVCIILLVWNAISYSFPFLLFILLCICVPMVSSIIGYNITLGSTERGASDDQISQLPTWTYTTQLSFDHDHQISDHVIEDPGKKHSGRRIYENPECCICLTKYKDKEEIRQLPCKHMFHQKCVDQWLRIISCCPLCKQALDQ